MKTKVSTETWGWESLEHSTKADDSETNGARILETFQKQASAEARGRECLNTATCMLLTSQIDMDGMTDSLCGRIIPLLPNIRKVEAVSKIIKRNTAERTTVIH